MCHGFAAVLLCASVGACSRRVALQPRLAGSPQAVDESVEKSPGFVFQQIAGDLVSLAGVARHDPVMPVAQQPTHRSGRMIVVNVEAPSLRRPVTALDRTLSVLRGEHGGVVLVGDAELAGTAGLTAAALGSGSLFLTALAVRPVAVRVPRRALAVRL